MTQLARIVRLPHKAGDEVQPFWLTADGLIEDRHYHPGDADFLTLALVAPEDAICRWHDYPALAPRQAEAAARIDAANASIDGDRLHIVARAADDGRVISAAVDRACFGEAVERLLAAGIDPDHIVPLGLLAPESGTTRIAFDGAAAVRQGSTIVPDDPAIAGHLIGDQPIDDLPPDAFAQALNRALQDPPLDLRSAAFAKRGKRKEWDGNKTRLALYATVAGILFSLLLALASWAKVDRAIAREDAKTVALAKKIVPEVAAASEAEAKIEQRLASGGGASSAFTLLSSALWQALQKTENVSLRDMRYGSDRILAVTLASPAVDPVNRLLIDLQQQGYRITATPRQEANGITAVAVTVRVP